MPVLASEGFCRNTGVSRENVLKWLQTGMFERMHPDDVGMLSQISDDFLNQRGPYDTVFRCRISPHNMHPHSLSFHNNISFRVDKVSCGRIQHSSACLPDKHVVSV